MRICWPKTLITVITNREIVIKLIKYNWGLRTRDWARKWATIN